MGIFRPGKPHQLWGFQANTVVAGPASYPFDELLESEGEWGTPHAGDAVVVAIAGLYLVTASLARSGFSSGARTSCCIQVNDVSVACDMPDPTGTAGIYASTAWVGNLSVDDVVHVQQDRPTTATHNRIGSHFSLVRVGPVRWT